MNTIDLEPGQKVIYLGLERNFSIVFIAREQWAGLPTSNVFQIAEFSGQARKDDQGLIHLSNQKVKQLIRIAMI